MGLALWILLALPPQVAVQWHLENSGVLTPSLTMSKPVACLITIGLGTLMMQLCKAAEHGFFRHSFFVWGRTFHPRLFPWLELAFHLCYTWLALGHFSQRHDSYVQLEKQGDRKIPAAFFL